MEEVVKDQSQEAQPQESKENAQPKHVLLNAISYDDPADYDKFFSVIIYSSFPIKIIFFFSLTW